MFNRRFLLVFGAVTVIVMALAMWLNRPAATQDRREQAVFISALAAQRDALNTIRIESKSLSLTLQRVEQRWQVLERDGFSADNAKVRELVSALIDAKIVENKTADPARYAKLGVDENGDKAMTLTLLADEHIIAHVIVGNSVYRPAGHYVRRAGEAASYLIDRELKVGREWRDWIDADLINLPATKINKIERLTIAPAIKCIKAPCETVAFSLSKVSGSSEFSVDNLAPGKTMQSAHIVSGLSDVMNGLTANDVIKAATLADTQVTTVTRFYSDDKQIVTLTYRAVSDKHWLSLDVSAAEDATPEVKAATDKLAVKLQGWAFEISSYKGEGLARGLDALTQKKDAK